MSDSKNASAETLRVLLLPYEQLLANLSDKQPLTAKLIETPLGRMLAVSNETSLVLLLFTESRHFDREMKHLIKVHSKTIIMGDDVKPLQAIETEINAYFDGKLRKFETPFQINPGEAPFNQQVWNELQKIDIGQTTTFAKLAKGMGKPNSAQPVANACSRNPLAIVIPCHRVASSGKAPSNSCVARRNWLLNFEEKFIDKE